MVLSCVALLNSQTAPVANPAAPAQPKAPAAVQANAPKQQTAAPKGKYFQAKVDLPANAPHDAASVVSSLGSPLPFQLAATPDGGSVLIYCTTSDVKKCDAKLLQKLEADIATLAGGGSFELIHFEHAAYVTGFVKEAQALKYRGITVEAAGGNAVKITRSHTVTDPDYERFEKDLRQLAWKFQPEAPASRVYYLAASDAATALGASAGSSDKSGASGNGGASASVTVQNLAAADAGPCPATGTTPSTGTKAGKSASSDGSDSSDSSADASSAGDPADSGQKQAQGGCPPVISQSTAGSQSKKDSSKFDVTVAPVNGDSLVFTDGTPGDDAAIAQRKRVLALLDFPRPEVLINTLSFQSSASNPEALAWCDQRLQSQIGTYNDSLQAGMARAWMYLQTKIGGGNFFDDTFYKYLTQRFVADSPAGENIPELVLPPSERKKLTTCDKDKYCLGYTTLFHPLRPNLTDMLIAVIASNDPTTEFRAAIGKMQDFEFGASPPNITSPSNQNCDERDAFVWSQADSSNRDPRFFPMYCFANAIAAAYPEDRNKSNLGKPLRAALVNFLFQYKMSQQYPEEFSSYELSQSAQELDSELNPLIVAFNRDLSAALQPIRDVAECKMKENGKLGWAGHGSQFVNNGIITVRTVSGKETVVDTETQSSFDVTSAPSITDVINSVGQAEKNIPSVLKTNLTANEAAVIIGALNSVQPTTSQVGREFKIDITPHSLSGASAAELDLNLTTAETAPPTRYAGGKSSADNLSRISKNNVSTKVRLESLKLFEISSFTAVVEQSRQNFPVLPPFVQIPYIGAFLSWPVPGAKEFHRSTAVMSAVVVPTAADIASGVVFSKDRVLMPGNYSEPGREICVTTADIAKAKADAFCNAKTALSLADFRGVSISEFNKRMAVCFSAPDSPTKESCGSINFDSLLPGH